MHAVMVSVLLITTAAAADGGAAPEAWLAVRYESAISTQRAELPRMPLRTPDAAVYWGLQYGPRREDALFLVFDCGKEYDRHDRVFVFSPGTARYQTPEVLKAHRNGDVQEFRKEIRAESQFGDVPVKYAIVLATKSVWHRATLSIDVVVDCELRHAESGKRARFRLYGTESVPIANGPSIKTLRIIDPPRLDLKWDHRTTPPRLKTRLDIGRFKLIPSSGLAAVQRVAVESDGKTAFRKSVRFEPDAPYGYFYYNPSIHMRPAVPFEAKVDLDLTPFMGVLSARARTVCAW